MSEAASTPEELTEEVVTRTFKNDGEPTFIKGTVTHNPVCINTRKWNNGGGATATYSLVVKPEEGEAVNVIVDVLQSEDRPNHDHFVEEVQARQPITIKVQQRVELIKDGFGRDVPAPASPNRTYQPALKEIEAGAEVTGFATL